MTAATSEDYRFTGRDAYDPGDYEGVAVRPVRLVRREFVEAWTRRWRLVRWR